MSSYKEERRRLLKQVLDEASDRIHKQPDWRSGHRNRTQRTQHKALQADQEVSFEAQVTNDSDKH